MSPRKWWLLVALTAALGLVFLVLVFQPGVQNKKGYVPPAKERFEPRKPIRRTESLPFEPALPSDVSGRNAGAGEPSSRSSGVARIGIILDDFGVNRHNVERCLGLPPEVAFAVIPHLPQSARIARAAHERGFDVFLHQPMEPHTFPRDNPGKYGIYLWQSTEEIVAILHANILSLGVSVAGVNNHMGSRATEDTRVMGDFFDAFPHSMIFLDSRTSEKSVAYDEAKTRGIVAIKNNVFLDHRPDTESVRREFDVLVNMARSRGFAVAIGHAAQDVTITVLEERLPALSDAGVRLVRLTDLARGGVRP